MGFRDGIEAAHTQRIEKEEQKALSKTTRGLRIVVHDVVGNAEMKRYLQRGWEIAAHSPQGYGQWFNQYQMIIDRETLENRYSQELSH